MNVTRDNLAKIAEEKALLPFHGDMDGKGSNIAPLISYFPKWDVSSADGAWCAAFVYYCCRLAGFEIPYSPDECVSCSLAGCGGWDEFAQGDGRIGYFKWSEDFSPEPGDIVLFDRVFNGQEHDHIGIVLKVLDDQLLTAEGNVENRSRIVTRSRSDRIRAFIRIPEGFRYKDGQNKGNLMKPGGTATLEPERLMLRKFTGNDAEAVFRNRASDGEVTKYPAWSAHTGAAGSEG